MNLVFIGKSCSGKTAIRDYICENFRYEKVITATTRDARPGESDGIDYHFVTKKKFESLLARKELIAPTKYNGNFYGMIKNDFIENDNKITIVDYEGALDIYCNDTENNIVFFNIYANDSIRTVRQLRRGDSDSDIINKSICDSISFGKYESGYYPEFDNMIYNVDNSGDNIFDAVDYILRTVYSES